MCRCLVLPSELRIEVKHALPLRSGIDKGAACVVQSFPEFEFSVATDQRRLIPDALRLTAVRREIGSKGAAGEADEADQVRSFAAVLGPGFASVEIEWPEGSSRPEPRGMTESTLSCSVSLASKLLQSVITAHAKQQFPNERFVVRGLVFHLECLARPLDAGDPASGLEAYFPLFSLPWVKHVRSIDEAWVSNDIQVKCCRNKTVLHVRLQRQQPAVRRARHAFLMVLELTKGKVNGSGPSLLGQALGAFCEDGLAHFQRIVSSLQK